MLHGTELMAAVLFCDADLQQQEGVHVLMAFRRIDELPVRIVVTRIIKGGW